MRRNAFVVITITLALITTAFIRARADDGRPPLPDVRAFDLPAAQIIDLAGRIVRFDTHNGALDLIQGDPSLDGNTAFWTRRVPPVREETSGALVMQMATSSGRAAFLVDAVNGTTWVLRWRGNQNGEWSRLELK